VTEEEELPIKITPENVASYLGNSYFRQRDHKAIKKGVAISLGGGEYGGRLTYIEAFKKSYNTRHEQARSVLFTGSLGKVFKEAMDISYTYARNFLQHDRKNTFLYANEVHIHAPDGAAKKDGSTDSLTIACALISLGIFILSIDFS
jgi:ATP-dependent Lon protease